MVGSPRYNKSVCFYGCTCATRPSQWDNLLGSIVGKNITSLRDSLDVLVLLELCFLQIILTITSW
jgi:hypothetical protein